MIIKDIDLRQLPNGNAFVCFSLDVPPSEFSEVALEIKNGKKYKLELKPVRNGKSIDQVAAIWGKIGEIAEALYTSKDEIYIECLKRYGPSIAVRTTKEALLELESKFRVVDVKQEREDGTIYAICYKGLSDLDTKEASVLLEGILTECRDIGISPLIRSYEYEKY